MEQYHNPVMLLECMEALDIKPDGIYIDATYGGGGHTKEILKRLKNGRLFAFDQDADAKHGVVEDARLTFFHGNFSNALNSLKEMNCLPVDGLLADLGISSHQIDEPSRGFSTRFDADLDMRMDQRSALTAQQVVNNYSVSDLQTLFSTYGEIRNAKQVANAIDKARMESKIVTTQQLKDSLKKCFAPDKEHQFMARIFQSLRIEVNQELNALNDLLEQSPELINQGGRLK